MSRRTTPSPMPATAHTLHGVRVVAAARGHDGDDQVVAVAEAFEAPLVVTADRGLRARVPSARIAGPGWLRGLLEPGPGHD